MEKSLVDMNAALANCLTLVMPPVEYPPQTRANPVQQDAADIADLQEHMASFFFHAKQLELQFLTQEASSSQELKMGGSKREVENEIQTLEAELLEKNELIEKYSEVVRGWEHKFKRLDSKMSAS